MSEICPKCGLVKELCVCETIAKESQIITVMTEKRAFGKTYTIVKGIDDKEIDMKDLAKKLKSGLACAGTAKDGKIELQGNHRSKVREMLVKIGYSPDSIEVR